MNDLELYIQPKIAHTYVFIAATMLKIAHTS